MFQNACKTLGFKKNMVYKIPPGGGEVNHIQPVAYLFLLCFRVRLFIDAFWLPAGKGLTSWLSSVTSNCEMVTFLLVSWVRCGA